MVNKYQLGTGRTIKIKFEETKATAFGGLALAERVASRVSFWTRLEKYLPRRKGQYNWIEVIKSAAAGLLTGSQGTYASEDIRRDEAALSILGLSQAPEEATFWRCLKGLGEYEMQENLGLFYRDEVRRILERARRRDIQVEGFIPVWGDGSLLEGSRRREGTKHIEGKGDGLLWTTIYVGPILASQQLAKEGEGESTVFKKLLPDVVKDILKTLRFVDKALLFLDSLHGDGPTLDMAEREGLHYLVGANKLAETRNVLQSQPEMVWESLGAEPEKKISEKAVCVCQIQCSNWSHSRTLVGMRWEYEGDFIKHYAGVITDLTEKDVEHLMKRGKSYARAVWHLYDRKMGFENYYMEPLFDLGLHHPPCREYKRNAGFYFLGALSHLWGRALDLLGGKRNDRGRRKRKDGKAMKRPTPSRMRLWRLRRQILTLPARVATHARETVVTFLGLPEGLRDLIERYWNEILQC